MISPINPLIIDFVLITFALMMIGFFGLFAVLIVQQVDNWLHDRQNRKDREI